MLKKVVFIYEDSERPNQKVKEITGNKSFGETILKRKTLKTRVLEEVEGESFIAAVFSYGNREEWEGVIQQLKGLSKEFSVVHMRSSFGIRNAEAFKILLEKAQFAQHTMKIVENEKTALVLCKNLEEYISYAMEYVDKQGIVSL